MCVLLGSLISFFSKWIPNFSFTRVAIACSSSHPNTFPFFPLRVNSIFFHSSSFCISNAFSRRIRAWSWARFVSASIFFEAVLSHFSCYTFWYEKISCLWRRHFDDRSLSSEVGDILEEFDGEFCGGHKVNISILLYFSSFFNFGRTVCIVYGYYSDALVL
jgi:hypothetical protein